MLAIQDYYKNYFKKLNPKQKNKIELINNKIDK